LGSERKMPKKREPWTKKVEFPVKRTKVDVKGNRCVFGEENTTKKLEEKKSLKDTPKGSEGGTANSKENNKKEGKGNDKKKP